MSIILHGPSWTTVTRLRERLAAAPETGEYRIGGPPTDAITQLTRFREAGLPTPDFTADYRTAVDWVMEGATVFGRRLIHTRGTDIYLPGPMRKKMGGWVFNQKWMASEWWSKYVKPTEEWRVHVFEGRVIARGRKVHTGQSWRKAPVRNILNGWTFDFSGNPPRGLRSTAKKAVATLQYPSGGVDILQIDTIAPEAPEGRETMFYVLEVNRIPALTCEYTLGAWERAIRRKYTPNPGP